MDVSKVAGKKTMLVTKQSGVVLVVERWLTEGLATSLEWSQVTMRLRSGGANVYTDVNFIVNVSETEGGIGEIMDAYEHDQEVIDAWSSRKRKRYTKKASIAEAGSMPKKMLQRCKP